VGVGGFLRHLILPYRIPVRSQLSHVKQPNKLGLLVAPQSVASSSAIAAATKAWVELDPAGGAAPGSGQRICGD
jgi:hypothetical protein